MNHVMPGSFGIRPEWKWTTKLIQRGHEYKIFLNNPSYNSCMLSVKMFSFKLYRYVSVGVLLFGVLFSLVTFRLHAWEKNRESLPPPLHQ